MNNFINTLYPILVNGGIVLGVFVILLINHKGARRTRANTFLSILLAALTFSALHLRYMGDLVHHFSLRTYALGDPTFLVISPLLWFYVIELTGGRVKFTPVTVLHFIPFVALIVCSLSFGTILADSAPIRLLNEHPRLPFIFFWMIVVIQFSTYHYFIHRTWRQYQSLIRQEISNTEDFSISWIRFFMMVFLLVNAVFLFTLFAVIHLDVMSWIWQFAGITLSLSIFALGYKGILQKDIFNSESTLPAPGNTTIKTEKADPLLVEKLQKFMLEQKPFLDPELSLSSLSRAFGVNRNQLSQLINDGVGDNFYDFINKYRVEEVKRLMADAAKQNYNLLGIALEAGFKSKSTFNLIFKRFTGLTPTDYKKNVM